MGNFFLWVFAFFFGAYLVMRLFGRQLLALGMRRLYKVLMKQAGKQSREYQQHYGGEGSFRENVYVDDSVQVSVPKGETKKQVSVDEIVEDVDYEELKS